MRFSYLITLAMAAAIQAAPPTSIQERGAEVDASISADFNVDLAASGQVVAMGGLGYGACSNLQGASRAGLDVSVSKSLLVGFNSNAQKSIMTSTDCLPAFLATINLQVGGQSVCKGSKNAIVTKDGYQCNCSKPGHSLYLEKNAYFQVKKHATLDDFCAKKFYFIYKTPSKSHRICLEAPKKHWKQKKSCKVNYDTKFKCRS